jgi:hypothetical protein
MALIGNVLEKYGISKYSIKRQISVNNLIFLKSQNATFWEFLGHDQIEDHSGKRITCPKALTP